MDDGDRGLEAAETYFRAAMANRKRRGEIRGQLMECEDCGKAIPPERIKAMPGCTRCVVCQTRFEKGV